MNDRRFKLKFILWLLVAAVLIYYFLHRLDWAEVRRSYGELDLALGVAAIVPVQITYLLRALRWRTFLAPIARPSTRNLFAATVIGFSSIFVFGRIGEVARPMMLSLKEQIRPSATVATIFIERLFDSTAVIFIFAVNMIFLKELIPRGPITMVRSVGLGLLGLNVLGLLGLSLYRWRAETVLRLLEKNSVGLPRRIQRVLLNLLRHLADGLYVLQDARGLAVTIGYTFLIWAFVSLSFWLLVRAFHVHLSLLSVLFLLGFALVGSLIPTPGGSAGAFHTTTMVGLVYLGVGHNKAASIAIALHIMAFGSALLFGVYFFVRDGLSFKALREMVSQEMVSLHDRVDPLEAETDAGVIGAKL